MTPGGYPGECVGVGATISAIPPHHGQASLWPPASVQALTITPTWLQAVVVFGAVIGCGHSLALQLPQCMDVELQSLLLNWLSLPGLVLQDRHMSVYKGVHRALSLPYSSVDPAAPSEISPHSLAGC